MINDKSSAKTVLDIGCGSNKVPGAVGLDKRSCKDVDVICDFEYGLPIRDSRVTAVYLRHVIEHVRDLVHLMEEIYRVSKKDAIVYVEAPYYSSRGAFRDPTHLHFISEDTFQYFEYPADYGAKTNFKIESIRYGYRKPFRYFPEYIRKRFRRYLLNVVDNLSVTLRAIK
jgi:ubiquinone/menaquinone biosynthesis C-methylase UbiE